MKDAFLHIITGFCDALIPKPVIASPDTSGRGDLLMLSLAVFSFGDCRAPCRLLAMTVLLSSIFLLPSFLATSAQAQQLNSTALLDSLLAAENYTAADSALQSQISIAKTADDFNSLANYPYYVGKLALREKSANAAMGDVERFTETFREKSERSYSKALIGSTFFYDELGRFQKSLDITQKARNVLFSLDEVTPEEKGKMNYILGVCFQTVGNHPEAAVYYKEARKNFTRAEKTNYGRLADTYNALGTLSWLATKPDSAKFYMEKAVTTIKESDEEAVTKLFQTTIIKSNISLIEDSQGNISEALAIQEEVIRDYQKVIDSTQEEYEKFKARRFQVRAISNMAGFYQKVGFIERSGEMLEYAYQKMQEFLEPDDSELPNTLIQIAGTKFTLQEYDEALQRLEMATHQINRADGDDPHLRAQVASLQAKAYLAKGNIDKAKTYFEEAETYFDTSFGNNYDLSYLDFLREKALFLAEHDEPETAVTTAIKAYNYVTNKKGADFSVTKHLLNVGETYFTTSDFKRAKEWSGKTTAYINKQAAISKTVMDSVQVEFQKPQALLLLAKAEYQLSSERDTTFLINQLNRLDEALTIIDKRKMLLTSEEDANIQIGNNKELFNFAKKIALELYKKTENIKYLNRTIEYHESGIYNRIQSRLNAQKAIRFTHIPDSILAKENSLKENITGKLGENDINAYLQANTNWQVFLEQLKMDYPRYFALRYGPIRQKTAPVIPKNATVVRYFFVDKDLYALLLTSEGQKLYDVDYSVVSHHIQQLHETPYDAAQTGRLLHDLYSNIWKPFEFGITTERVIIIPDGELFNFSFETLVTAPVKSFSELAQNSLLARHAVSYQYSLNLLNGNQAQNFDSDLVAFAPGFDDDLKKVYEDQTRDSLFLDRTYLNLLPQPFTVDLVTELRNFIGGYVYTGPQSTKQKFILEANGHKVIHIGTHAESNNLNPEYSRLFFAKDTEADNFEDDNLLYAYEIYNYNLSSNLTLLTACSTGKPQYQPGEGMISLAHAFNYAGSQSLLTGLWNIDEKASTEIVDLFYQNLSDGFSKDVALQRAKLTYLENAEGRTAAPEYWAGLVVLGDAEAISLGKATPSWSWFFAGIILLAVVGGYWLVKRKRI